MGNANKDKEENHVVSLLSEQIIKIEITDKEFNPGDYVKWKPDWHVHRDWGVYS